MGNAILQLRPIFKLALLGAILYALALLTSGCDRAPKSEPVITNVILVKTTELSVLTWDDEARRQFPGAVVVFCHGNDVNDVWTAFPDNAPAVPVTTLALTLKSRYPNRPIILVVCNPNARRINIPGVYYSLESVWAVPDRVTPRLTPLGWESGCGQVSEFVTGEK